MLVEWLRRTSPAWNERLRKFLFTTRALGHEAEETPDAVAMSSGVGLGVGSLKRSTP
jgi:hypothetical protein